MRNLYAARDSRSLDIYLFQNKKKVPDPQEGFVVCANEPAATANVMLLIMAGFLLLSSILGAIFACCAALRCCGAVRELVPEEEDDDDDDETAVKEVVAKQTPLSDKAFNGPGKG